MDTGRRGSVVGHMPRCSLRSEDDQWWFLHGISTLVRGKYACLDDIPHKVDWTVIQKDQMCAVIPTVSVRDGIPHWKVYQAVGQEGWACVVVPTLEIKTP